VHPDDFAQFGNGKTMIAFFSFSQQYRNWLEQRDWFLQLRLRRETNRTMCLRFCPSLFFSAERRKGDDPSSYSSSWWWWRGGGGGGRSKWKRNSKGNHTNDGWKRMDHSSNNKNNNTSLTTTPPPTMRTRNTRSIHAFRAFPSFARFSKEKDHEFHGDEYTSSGVEDKNKKKKTSKNRETIGPSPFKQFEKTTSWDLDSGCLTKKSSESPMTLWDQKDRDTAVPSEFLLHSSPAEVGRSLPLEEHHPRGRAPSLRHYYVAPRVLLVF
jgi:hypothetical protein